MLAGTARRGDAGARRSPSTSYTPGRITETLLDDYEKLVRMSPADVAKRLAS